MGGHIVSLDPQKLNWFIEQQVRLGKIAENEWEFFNQSEEEYLRRLYRSDECDPSTRLYWVDGEIKGFITSKIVTSISGTELYANDLPLPLGIMSPPIVRPRSEQIEKALINESIRILETKGVKTIVCNVSPSWGFNDYLQEKGFQQEGALVHRAIIDLPAFSFEHNVNIEDCTRISAKEKADLLAKNLGYSPEFAKNVISNLPTFVEEIKDFCFLERGVRAWARLTKSRGKWRMGPVYSRTVPDTEATDAMLGRIQEFLEQKGAQQLTILCGRQGEHLLKNFRNRNRFTAAMQRFVLPRHA
ncbi:MAG: hypothetical protein D6732_15795 [Methanobacteriota archaeon]|nr:MAG: hypothetical protein D6732_15795 [Euryarchaeota archaeon]